MEQWRSRPWWNYARNIIKLYPDHHRNLEELHRQSLTPNYEATGGHGSTTSDPTGMTAIRELPGAQQREHDAVDMALQWVKTQDDADERIRVIDLVFWRRTHTYYGAGRDVGWSERTCQRKCREFIVLVAKNIGCL